VVLGLGVPATQAEAGGATFSFHNRWFAAGQIVVGKTQFDLASNEAGRVFDGPYFAYLLRGERWIEPPHLPRDAIRVGQVEMSRAANGFWWASVRFVVPKVPPGQYMVSLCNDPCRSSNVGDLVGAWIFIANSAEQAKIKNMEIRIADRVMEGMSQQLSDMSVELEQLRQALGSAPPSGITVGTELRLEPLEEQVKSMAAELRRLRDRSDHGLPAWLWLAGWLVAGSIAAAWWRSRRPRIAPRRRDSSGRGGLEASELEAIAVPVHLDRVAVSDLS
jgi:hypothetical protein